MASLTNDQRAFASEVAQEIAVLIRKRIAGIPSEQVCKFVIAVEEELEGRMDDLLENV